MVHIGLRLWSASHIERRPVHIGPRLWPTSAQAAVPHRAGLSSSCQSWRNELFVCWRKYSMPIVRRCMAPWQTLRVHNATQALMRMRACTCMHVCMDAWAHGCTGACAYGRTDTLTDACTDACMDARTHAWMHGPMHGCTDARTHPRAHTRTCEA